MWLKDRILLRDIERKFPEELEVVEQAVAFMVLTKAPTVCFIRTWIDDPSPCGDEDCCHGYSDGPYLQYQTMAEDLEDAVDCSVTYSRYDEDDHPVYGKRGIPITLAECQAWLQANVEA